MVKGSVVANSPLLLVLVAVGLLIVIAYAVLSVVKASQRCKELGVSSETISNVVKATATSSIVPSLAILLGFLTLTVSLGVIWPWWRLSVIGSLSFRDFLPAEPALFAIEFFVVDHLLGERERRFHRRVFAAVSLALERIVRNRSHILPRLSVVKMFDDLCIVLVEFEKFVSHCFLLPVFLFVFIFLN